jgi:hypothetical protein
MFLVPFILWGMAQAEGWNTLWLFPLSLVALFVYDVVGLFLAYGVILLWTKVYRRIPERVVLAIGTAIWVLIGGSFMVAFFTRRLPPRGGTP